MLDRLVMGEVPPDSRILGYPARPEAQVKRGWVTMEHLPDWRRDLKRVKDHLGLRDE